MNPVRPPVSLRQVLRELIVRGAAPGADGVFAVADLLTLMRRAADMGLRYGVVVLDVVPGGSGRGDEAVFVRELAIVVRLLHGGLSFRDPTGRLVVLLPACDAGRLDAAALRLRELVIALHHGSGSTPNVYLGVAHDRGELPTGVLARAEASLYDAQLAGTPIAPSRLPAANGPDYGAVAMV